MFDTVLFDLDGTLTDPFKGIANSVIYALKNSVSPPRKKRCSKNLSGRLLRNPFQSIAG